VSVERRDPELERAVREAYQRPIPVPPLDRDGLLRALASEPTPRRRGWALRLPPLSLPAAATAAAALLVAGIMAGAALERRGMIPSSARRAAGDSQMIHFALVAPRASQVAVVGDFNGWDTRATPMRKLASGATWTAAIPVREGRYAYAFVIDGRTWMPDPAAPLAPGDGFGHESSVLVVPAGRSAS